MSFDERADTWDSSERRQRLADAVAKAILNEFELQKRFELLDVGAGTGLLSRRLLPFVSSITGVDTSEGMLEKFAALGPKAEGVLCDILSYETDRKFDGIISSMTMHHIEDTQALFHKLRSLLKPGGFIALADLTPEDGSFHDHGNSGVYHFGFDEDSLRNYALEAGFTEIKIDTVCILEKNGGKRYPIFLLCAKRSGPAIE